MTQNGSGIKKTLKMLSNIEIGMLFEVTNNKHADKRIENCGR